jgi:GDP/UDP-N,N'-diacetylbacillosamine 2-epimerase (hydrolysing)
MQEINQDAGLELQTLVTGTHLSPEFGLTYRAILEDKLKIDKKIEILVSSDTAVGLAKSAGLGLIGFADALSELDPDILLVLGDRYEIFSAVFAALPARIPVAHIHGGEVTEGAIDEAIRHSITKMSHLHFVANDVYKKRVIQLGENPDNVFVVGALGVDAIQRLQLLSKKDLEKSIDFKFGKKNLLITFHPATAESIAADEQVDELLMALSHLEDTHFIFTFPNADTGSSAIRQKIVNFAASHSNTRVYDSLGQLLYLSCLAHVDAVVGNSSSGIIEAPTLKTATINIGDRQLGRLFASSVIQCEPDRDSISAALETAFNNDFQVNLGKTVNPYGSGGASQAVVSMLKSLPLQRLAKKSFYDWP